MIEWNSLSPGDNLTQVIAPGSNGNNLPLPVALKQYIESRTLSRSNFYLTRKHNELIENILGKKGINDLTVKDANKIVRRMTGSIGVRKAKGVRSHLAAVIRLVKTGEHPHSAGTNSTTKKEMKTHPPVTAMELGSKTVRLKIGEAPTTRLVELLGPSLNGRFASLKSDIKKAVESCPKDQFRTVFPSQLMIQNKSERDGARMAIQKMLTTFHPDWVARWSASEEVFVVCREEDLRRATGKTQREGNKQ